MAAILVLSMPEDEATVRNVVGALSESDLDVFWERAEPGSLRWKDAQDRAAEARAVIFFWSRATHGEAAGPYLTLARRALQAGKAICVLLDSGPTPEALAACTTYDLRGWRSRRSSLFMLDLVAAAKAKAAGLDPPLQRAPRQLFLRRLALLVPTVIAGIALAAGLYRDVGLDRLASREEKRDWAAVRPGSCADLWAFVAKHRDGAHAEEAQRRLAARRVVPGTRWVPAERPLPIYVPASQAAPAPGRASALAAAAKRAEAEAVRSCERLARASTARLLSAKTASPREQCETLAGGVVCAIDAEAVCRLAEPVEANVERC